jgi:hypothetical protein
VRLYIRGPHLGPVRTTLWSSGRRRSGSARPVAILFLILIAGALSIRFWYITVPAIAVLLGALALVGVAERRKRGPDGIPDSVRKSVASINAKPADIRARLREQNRTGELAPIPGWHWTSGNLLEREWPILFLPANSTVSAKRSRCCPTASWYVT